MSIRQPRDRDILLALAADGIIAWMLFTVARALGRHV